MYDALAKFYDAFMADIDYEAWTDYVISFLGTRKNGIDFACGTGKFTLGLEKRGYGVYGVDQSIEMLNVAQSNASRAGCRSMFLQGGIESFCPSHPVEFVVLMCDGINYVKNLSAAFGNLYASLSTGGILIFDVSTEYKLKNIIGNNTFFDETKEAVYVWKNRFSEKKRCVEMDLILFERDNDERYIRQNETQTQYIHAESEVAVVLAEAGFVNVRCYGGLTRRAPDAKAERIHFVAEKA